MGLFHCLKPRQDPADGDASRIPGSLARETNAGVLTETLPRSSFMRRLIISAALVAVGTWALVGHFNPAIEAGTAIRLEVADLARSADLVLEGRVLDAHVVEGETGLIETEYLMSVDRTLWGADLGSRVVRLPGGVLPDGRGMMIPGMPRVSIGEDVMFFLSKQTDWGMRMPMGLAQGKFSIVRGFGGERRLVRDQASLTYVDAATGRVSESPTGASLDYAAVVSEVYAALAQRQAPQTLPQGREED